MVSVRFGASVTTRFTVAGIFTSRPTSSVTMRPRSVCAAIIRGAELVTNATAIIVIQTRSRRTRFNSCLQQKSLARIARLIAAPFLAKDVGFAWHRYIPDFQRPFTRRADHSGGTVADFHGLPDARASSIVAGESMLHLTWCQSVSLQRF